MVKLLGDEAEEYDITKEGLVDLEAKVLIQFGFDLNFPDPYAPMERYIRLLGYDKNETVLRLAYQICKFSMNEAEFLDYKPSQIAASAVIISINIF